jgi:hypothetical protein
MRHLHEWKRAATGAIGRNDRAGQLARQGSKERAFEEEVPAAKPQERRQVSAGRRGFA